MFIKNKAGKYVYRIELKNNAEIVEFVSEMSKVKGDVKLVGFDGGIKCFVHGKSLLGVMYASVLDGLTCISDENIAGLIAKFIVEAGDNEVDE